MSSRLSLVRGPGCVARLVALVLVLLPGVALAASTINLSFSPPTINPGDPSRINISIYNSGFADLTSAAITVNLASGVTIAATPAPSDSCGFTTVNAPAGGTAIVLDGGTVPAATPGGPDGSCTFSVAVNSVGPGNHTTTLPADGPANGFVPGGATSGYSADDGGLTVSNSTTASATLAVNSLSAPTGSMSFSPASVYVGEVTTLTVTLTNANASVTLPLTTFTDTLPAGMALAATPSGSVACTGAGASNGTLSSPSVPGTLTAGDTAFTLTGGVIGNGGSCVVQLNVKAPATVGSVTNPAASNANAIGNTRGLSSAAFSRSLTVNNPITVSQSVTPSGTVRAGQAVSLRLTVSNASSANALSIASFTDNLAAGLVVDAGIAPTVSCSGTGFVNGTVTATPGSSVITLANATAGKSGNCQVTVGVSMNAAGTKASTSATTVPNGTQMTNAAVTPTNITVPSSTVNVTAESAFTVAKSVSPSSGTYQGRALAYTVTISNWSAGAAGNVSFTDTLPTVGGVPMQLAAGSALGAGCSGGTFTAAAGTSSVTWTGGTVAAGSGTSPGTCQITIQASMPATATIGSVYTNNLGANSVTGTDINSGAIANTNTASVSSTTAASLTVAQSLTPLTTIVQGGSTTLRITLTNPTAADLTNLSFTETLDSHVTIGSAASTTTCTGTPVITAVAGTGTLSVTGVTVPANNGSCRVQVPVTSMAINTGSGWANTIGTGDITTNEGQTNSSAASVSLKVSSALSGSAAFSPASVGLNGTTRYTLTLTNGSTVNLTGIAVTDPLPTGGNAMVVAPVPNESSSCGSPTLTATANATSVTMTGGSLAAGASCTLSYDVLTTTGSSWTHTIPAGNVTSAESASNTSSITASATNALTATAAFSPTSTGLNGSSRLTVTLSNGGAAAFTNTSFTSALPTGATAFVLAATPNASSTCAGSPSITATPGASSIAISGATLAAGTSCAVSFDITTTAISGASWSYSLPANAITTNEGAKNSSAATATLTKVTGTLGLNKSFSPISIVGGSPSTLQIDITNPVGGSTAVNGVALTDTFPSGMEVFSVPNARTTCTNGIVSAASGGTSVSLSGADIAVGASCSVFVDVTSVRPLNLTNTLAIGALRSSQGFTNAVATSASLSTLQGVGVEKSFSPSAVAPNQVSRLTVKLISTLNSVSLSNVSMTDNLPAGVVLAPTPNFASACNTAPTGSAGTGSVAIAGVALAPQSNCSFGADVVAASIGSYTNTIAVGGVTSTEGYANQNAANATLLVLSAPTVGLSFTSPTVQSGASSTLVITVSNPSSTNLTGVGLIQPLPSGLAVALTPGASTTCSSGSVVATAAGGSIALSGASLSAGASCTFRANVSSNSAGAYTATTAAGAITTPLGVTNAATASATLTVLQFPTVSQSLSVPGIVPGGTSTLTLTLGNANASAITLSNAFNVALPASPGNLLVANPNGLSKTCPGSVTATAGTGTIGYANGASIPAGGCTIAVAVTATPLGTYVNTIAAGALQTSAGNSQAASTVSLVVSNSTPPVANNVSAAVNNDVASPQAIGPLSGSATAPATVSSYSIRSLPSASVGSLYCGGVAVASVPQACAANQVGFLPAPGATGTTTFTYTVTDSSGTTSSNATGTITVNGPPTANALSATINNNASPAVAIGPLAGTAQVGATVTGATIASLPAAGLDVYCNAVRVSAVPTACGANQVTVLPVGSPTTTATFTYTVTDSNGMTSSPATVTVAFNTPPLANAVTNPAIAANAASAVSLSPLTGSVTTVGATLSSYTVVSLPAAGTLSCNATPVAAVPTTCAPNALAYRPSGAAVNPVTFTFTVTDSNGMTSTAATVTIPLNAAPSATPLSARVNNNAGSAVAIGPLAGTAQAGATLTGSTIVSLPASGLDVYCNAVPVTAVPTACGAAQVTVLPTGSPTTTRTFTYTVTDSNGMTSAPATVTVDFNTPPLAQAVTNPAVAASAASAVALSPMSGSVTSPGASVAGHTVATLPSSGTLSCNATPIAAVPAACANTALAYRPSGSVTGTVSFTYTVTDSNGMVSTPATFTIPLTAQPVASGFTAAVNNDAATPVAIGPMAATAQTGATITGYEVLGLPAGASLRCNGTPIASVPSACAAAGLSVLPVGQPTATTTLSFRATDSNGAVSAPATGTITWNTPPTAQNISARIPASATSPQPLPTLAGAVTTAGATLVTYRVLSLPPAGQGTLLCAGTPVATTPTPCAAAALSLQPMPSASGTATFTYGDTDSNGQGSAPAVVTITFGRPPAASNLTQVIGPSASGAATPLNALVGTPASPGTTITLYTITTLPAGGTLACAGVPVAAVPTPCAAGALTFRPDAGASGNLSFGYTVTDSDGLTSTPATVTLVLHTPPVARALSAGPLDNAASTPQPLPALSGSATTPGATITAYTITALPSASLGTLSCDGVALATVPAACAAGHLSFGVAPGATGNASFAYTVTDSEGLVSAPALVSVALAGSPALTLAKTSSGVMTVGFEATYTLQVSNRSDYTATRAPIVVTDTLPAGLDFLSAGGTAASSGWTCNWAPSSRLLSCSSSAVVGPRGDAEPIALRVRPTAAALASGATAAIVNTARVEGGGESPNYADGSAPGAKPHSATDTQTVQRAAVVSGSVWVDLNANGLRDPDEPMLDAGAVRVEVWPAGTTADAARSGTPIASALIDASGQYAISVPPADVQVRFVNVASSAGMGAPVNGETAATRNQPGSTGSSGVSHQGVIDHIVLAPGATVTQQSLPVDPQGFVYDSGTRLPIGGAAVTLRADGNPVPTACLTGGANPFVTAASGSFAGGYQFLIDFAASGCAALSGATFSLDVAATGYRFPSALIPPGANGSTVLRAPAGTGTVAVVPKAAIPTADDPTTHYLAIVLGAGTMGVVNNHLPLDGTARAALALTKAASRSSAEVGDVVRYTVTVRNTGTAILPTVALSDRLPLGFKLVAGSARLTLGGATRELATTGLGPTLEFALPGLAAGSSATLQYLVRLGIGSDRGDGINRVHATSGSLTADASARVQVSGGVFGTEACVVGKVFMDCNGNAVQDEGEPGVPAVRLWLETGLSLTTDSDGRFAYCGLSPRTHSIKIDRSTLPPGVAPQISSQRNLGDPNSLLLDPKSGELVRADFPLGRCTPGSTPPTPRPSPPPPRGSGQVFESHETNREVRHD